MTVDDCERAYIQMLSRLHETKLRPWDIRRIFGKASFDSMVYEAAIKEIIQDALLKDPSSSYDRGTNDSNLPLSAGSGTCKLVECYRLRRSTRQCRV